MARTCVDGFQSSPPDAEKSGGRAHQGVNAMVLHWPGGGKGKAGRDAHSGYGTDAVYPGGKFDMHLKPFTEGAFVLDGATRKAERIQFALSPLQERPIFPEAHPQLWTRST